MDTFPSVIPSAPLEAAGELEPGRMGSTQGVVPIWTPHTPMPFLWFFYSGIGDSPKAPQDTHAP